MLTKTFYYLYDSCGSCITHADTIQELGQTLDNCPEYRGKSEIRKIEQSSRFSLNDKVYLLSLHDCMSYGYIKGIDADGKLFVYFPETGSTGGNWIDEDFTTDYHAAKREKRLIAKDIYR